MVAEEKSLDLVLPCYLFFSNLLDVWCDHAAGPTWPIRSATAGWLRKTDQIALWRAADRYLPDGITVSWIVCLVSPRLCP